MDTPNVIGEVDPQNIDDVALVENWAAVNTSFPRYGNRNWQKMVHSANENLARHINGVHPREYSRWLPTPHSTKTGKVN